MPNSIEITQRQDMNTEQLLDYIGVELNPEYIELGEKRIATAGGLF